MLIFNLFVRDQPISERMRARERENKVVDIHTERMTEKKNITSSILFYLIMYIQSLITTVVFPICQCRISRSFLLRFNPFIIRVFQVMDKIK